MSFAGLLIALRGDAFLMRRSRGARTLVLLSMAIAAGRVALGKLSAIAREAQGSVQASAAAGNGHGPLADGMAAGLAIGTLVLLALAAASVAGDRDLGVVRVPLTRGVSRGAYILSKFVAFAALGLLMTAAVFLASWAASASLYDFGAVVEDGYEIFGAAEVRREIALGIGAAALPLPAVVALGLLVSASARSATEAVATALPIALAFDAMKGLLGKAAGFVFLSFPPTLLDRSYLSEAAKLARGFSDAGYPDGLLRLNLAVPIPEAALLLAAALWIAGRRKM